jgi:diacylglycerol kinase (ATP)
MRRQCPVAAILYRPSTPPAKADVNPSDATRPVAVLINPTAGRGRHRAAVPLVLETLRSTGRDVRVLDADGPQAALSAARAAVAGGAGALITAGGDGTVNLGLQAVAGTGIGFGAIPMGTGNDFIREVGLPIDPVEAAGVVAAALASGERRTIDLARMVPADGPARWFGAVLGAGFDALVNERANRMRFPRGPRRYDVAIFAELVRLRPRDYVIRLDGVEHRLRAVLVAVGNTPAYGGGMRICPAADPTDGLLDIVIAGPIGRTTLVRIKPRVYAGTHVSHPMVTAYRATTVELDAPGITTYVDGERAAPLPVTITAVPGALSLLAG